MWEPSSLWGPFSAKKPPIQEMVTWDPPDPWKPIYSNILKQFFIRFWQSWQALIAWNWTPIPLRTLVYLRRVGNVLSTLLSLLTTGISDYDIVGQNISFWNERFSSSVMTIEQGLRGLGALGGRKVPLMFKSFVSSIVAFGCPNFPREVSAGTSILHSIVSLDKWAS